MSTSSRGKARIATDVDESLDATPAEQRAQQTQDQMVAPEEPMQPVEAAAKVAGAPAPVEVVPEEPEEGVERTCVNCGKPAVFRTTSKGASTLYFCAEDRPNEGVEQIAP